MDQSLLSAPQLHVTTSFADNVMSSLFRSSSLIHTTDDDVEIDEEVCSTTGPCAVIGEPTTACNGERHHQERDRPQMNNVAAVQPAASMAQNNLSTLTRLAGSACHIDCVITQVCLPPMPIDYVRFMGKYTRYTSTHE